MGALDPNKLIFAVFALIFAAGLVMGLFPRRKAPTQYDRRIADERERKQTRRTRQPRN